ncbi:TonB family protein [Luteimonas sp. WGS1318]
MKLRRSGYDLLDAEALDTVHRASPVPPPPDALPGRAETVVVPVEFFIHH